MAVSSVRNQTDRWCQSCLHEAHVGNRCLFRMSSAAIMRLLAQGRSLPADLRCRCE